MATSAPPSDRRGTYPEEEATDGMSTATSDQTADEAWQRLGAAAQLLHRAALTVWSRAEDQPPDSPLYWLGLGVLLAEADVAALLPGDHELPDPDVEPDRVEVLQLLTSVEELTRGVPSSRLSVVAASRLAADLCDLIWEARTLGY